MGGRLLPWEGEPRVAPGHLKRLQREKPTERTGSPPERKGGRKQSLVAFHYGERYVHFRFPDSLDPPLGQTCLRFPLSLKAQGIRFAFILSMQQGPLPATHPPAPFPTRSGFPFSLLQPLLSSSPAVSCKQALATLHPAPSQLAVHVYGSSCDGHLPLSGVHAQCTAAPHPSPDLSLELP